MKQTGSMEAEGQQNGYFKLKPSDFLHSTNF